MIKPLTQSSIFSTYNNFIEAAAAGASAAISLVANVAANLIAFIALLHFTNSAISWFGSFVCYPELSFEVGQNKVSFLNKIKFALFHISVTKILQ